MLKTYLMQVVVGLALLLSLAGGSALGSAPGQVHASAVHTASVHPYPGCLPALPPC